MVDPRYVYRSISTARSRRTISEQIHSLGVAAIADEMMVSHSCDSASLAKLRVSWRPVILSVMTSESPPTPEADGRSAERSTLAPAKRRQPLAAAPSASLHSIV